MKELRQKVSFKVSEFEMVAPKFASGKVSDELNFFSKLDQTINFNP
jgi:hypothetical protein